MFGYIVRRLIAAFLVVVVTSMLVFAVFFYGPSDPAAALCGETGRCTEQRKELLEHQLGLDQSGVSQYGVWVKGMFQDRQIEMGAVYDCAAPCLGIAYDTKLEVRKELVDKFPATVSLAIGASALYLVIGVTVGSIAAKYRGSTGDRSLMAGSLLISSIPYIVFALLAWLYLVNKWSIFPDTGYTPLTDNPGKWAAGLLLPWLVLAIANMVNYARFSRGSMVETLGEDYIRTALAKGLSRNRSIFKHGLRASIVTVMTIFGLDLAALLTGTLVTEKIFEIDGIGAYGFDAIRGALNFPVLSAVVFVSAIIIVVANLLVDLLYTALDPRVRLT